MSRWSNVTWKSIGKNIRSGEKENIRKCLSTPLIKGFDELVKEATKFVISLYHKVKICLDDPIEITSQLFR